MPLKILLCILPFVFISCSLLSKEECQKSSVAISARKDGANGVTNRYKRTEKKCSKSEFLKSTYNNAYTAGILEFCTFSRGKEQAALGLKKESICLISANYTAGHLKELENSCNPKRAQKDAQNLLNSDNRLCLLLPNYKNSYLRYLKKQCSFKKGYTLGISKKDIGQKCKDSKFLKFFKAGHKSGLNQGLTNENRKLRKEIKTIKTQRQKLQKKMPSLKEDVSIQKAKIELNILESKLLEHEHKIEKNMRFIN